MMSDKTLAGEMRHRTDRSEEPRLLQDVFDGEHYKNLLQNYITWRGHTQLPLEKYFAQDTEVALGFGTDGIAPLERVAEDFWPLLVTIYNLPPEMGTQREYQICFGLIPGKTSKHFTTTVDMTSYLQPFIESPRQLACEGVEARHWDGRVFRLKAHLLTVSGDMPAISKSMKFKGVNAKLPCRFCKLAATPHTGLSGHITYYLTLSPNGRNIHDYSRLPLRTDKEIKRAVRTIAALRKANGRVILETQEGISGDSIFHVVGSIDFPGSFTPDLMHILFENVMKQLFTLWDGSEKARRARAGQEAWMISATDWGAVSEDINHSNHTIPAQLSRSISAPLDSRSSWTAETLSFFLLFMGPIVLQGRLGTPYYRNFLKLSDIARTLTKLAIERDTVNRLHREIGEWVQNFERLYYGGNPSRLHNCTAPVHVLLHVAPVIMLQGPPCYYWCFSVERFGGWRKRNTANRKDIMKSLTNAIIKQEQIHAVLATLPEVSRRRFKLWQDRASQKHRGLLDQEEKAQDISGDPSVHGTPYYLTEFRPDTALSCNYNQPRTSYRPERA